MKTFNIKFEGFYGSVHESEIDYQLESYYSDDNGDPVEQPENIDYKKIYTAYSELYTESFEHVLNEQFKLDINIEFKSLYSPKYYNYETDSIDAKISDNDFEKLKVKTLTDTDFISFVTENSKSHSGFTSFYTGINEVAADDEILLIYIGQFIIECFSDDINEHLYNEQYINELLYSLDFEIKNIA